MSQRIVSNIETCCDICNRPIYGDPHPNKLVDQVFIEGKSFTVSLNLDVFEFHRSAEHLCVDCTKQLLQNIISKWE